MILKRRRRNKWKKLLIILFAGVILFYAGATIVKTYKAVLSAKTQHSLQSVVADSLKDTDGAYGIMIKNLKTGETFGYNENKMFKTGSLYKLWIMAETYDQIQQGKVKEDEDLSEDVSVLNDKFNIASEDAELTDGTIELTVADALNQMITISHNYAALLLTERIRLSTVDSFLKKYGFSNSTVGIHGAAPTTTASDIALFFEKLYQGQLANKESTDEMIELLKNQQLNNKLPKYLPPQTTIAHKTGELDSFSHDAGIVYTKQGNYIIVILSDTKNPPAAEEKIADISQQIYNYFLEGGERI